MKSSNNNGSVEKKLYGLSAYYVKKDVDMNSGVGILVQLGKKVNRKLRILSVRVSSRILRNKLQLYCPCCDTYLKCFIDAGYDKRPDRFNKERYRGMDQNVICPVCGSLPRHRILVEWMDEHKKSIRESKILHFAQEYSVRIWMDRNHISNTSADLYSHADLKLDIEDTGLSDGSYDLIICNHVLEHVLNYRKALAELYRIVSPGGRVIVSFPVDPMLKSVYEDSSIQSERDRIRCFGQNDHLRVFGMDSPEMLAEFGFKVDEIRGEKCDHRIKPVIGPANYDYNVLWCLTK